MCGMKVSRFSGSLRRIDIRTSGVWAEVPRVFAEVGFFMITAFVSPYRKNMDLVRTLLPRVCLWKFISQAQWRSVSRVSQSEREPIEAFYGDLSLVRSSHQS